MASAFDELRELAGLFRSFASEAKAGNRRLTAEAWEQAAERVEEALDRSDPEQETEPPPRSMADELAERFGYRSHQGIGVDSAAELLRAGRALAVLDALTGLPGVPVTFTAELPGNPVEIRGSLSMATLEDFALAVRGLYRQPKEVPAPAREPRHVRGRAVPPVERILEPVPDPVGNTPGTMVSCRGCGAQNPAGLMVRGDNGYFCDKCAADALAVCSACGGTDRVRRIKSSGRALCRRCIENGEPQPPRTCPECGLARGELLRFAGSDDVMCDVCRERYDRRVANEIAEAAAGDPGEAGEEELRKDEPDDREHDGE